MRRGFRNHVTLTFDLLTSGSTHAERLPRSMCTKYGVDIAQAVFLLERGRTQTDTDATDHPNPRIGYATG